MFDLSQRHTLYISKGHLLLEGGGGGVVKKPLWFLFIFKWILQDFIITRKVKYLNLVEGMISSTVAASVLFGDGVHFRRLSGETLYNSKLRITSAVGGKIRRILSPALSL